MLVVLPIPYVDPVAAFAPLAGEPYSVLLDSAAEAGGRGRTSYVAHDPYRTVVATDEGTRVDGRSVAVDPITALEGCLLREPLAPGACPVPFATGAVGLLGYELARHVIRAPAPRPDDLGVPDLAFGVYDCVAAFDVIARRAWVLSSGLPETDPARRRARATARAEALAARLGCRALAPPTRPPERPFRPSLSAEDYAERVSRALEHIRAGDVYQVNLTQRFVAERPPGLTAFDLYRRLREESPAPFAGLFVLEGDTAIVSASPERFLRVDAAGEVEARPIKGTRARGGTPEEDLANAEALLDSPKDRAENVMIVDLLRNDLGRVSVPGSVRVPSLCALETFPRVHHLVSSITSTLRPGHGPFELLRAAFPGGSITGAPKERAVAILRDLEPTRRGPYCGSLAWIGTDGAMDASILIRTITLTREGVVANAGGGVVADSDPLGEHEEALLKARPLLATLGGHLGDPLARR